MPIVSMILLEGNGNKEDEIIKEIPLDDKSKKYIHVTANNIIKTYESEKEKITIKKYPMEKCLKSNMKSEYEKQFYDLRMETSHYYCAQDGLYI